MAESTELVWTGERNLQLNAYRPCRCGVCSTNRKGVGYLSSSNTNGRGFTIWIENEKIFRRVRFALRHLRTHLTDQQDVSDPNEGLHHIAPPKPDRLELLKQVRRATIEDQLHLLAWLEKKYAKIRPLEKQSEGE